MCLLEFNPSISFLLVSILRGIPFSIRSMVNGEIPAFLASSALRIRRDSRISFKEILRVINALHDRKISKNPGSHIKFIDNFQVVLYFPDAFDILMLVLIVHDNIFILCACVSL